MSYPGTLKEGGTKFDSVSKFTFTNGGGEVIKGWEVGHMGEGDEGWRQENADSAVQARVWQEGQPTRDTG